NWLGAIRSPSAACQLTVACGSSRLTHSSNQAVPHRTPASREMTVARTWRSPGTRLAVRSPAPMSSVSAASTLRAISGASGRSNSIGMGYSVGGRGGANCTVWNAPLSAGASGFFRSAAFGGADRVHPGIEFLAGGVDQFAGSQADRAEAVGYQSVGRRPVQMDAAQCGLFGGPALAEQGGD